MLQLPFSLRSFHCTLIRGMFEKNILGLRLWRGERWGSRFCSAQSSSCTERLKQCSRRRGDPTFKMFKCLGEKENLSDVFSSVRFDVLCRSSTCTLSNLRLSGRSCSVLLSRSASTPPVEVDSPVRSSDMGEHKDTNWKEISLACFRKVG
jgi:hypothetical protein